MRFLLITLCIISPIIYANDDDETAKDAAIKAEEERCQVPAFAKAIGHEELWKIHNGCATPESQKTD